MAPGCGDGPARQPRRAAHLVPPAMFLTLVGSGTAMMFAARARHAWLVVVAVIVLAGSFVGLALSVMWLDRQMRGDEWTEFEEAFWRYVSRRGPGEGHE